MIFVQKVHHFADSSQLPIQVNPIGVDRLLRNMHSGSDSASEAGTSLLVVLERLRTEPDSQGRVAENVREPHLVTYTLHPSFQEF